MEKGEFSRALILDLLASAIGREVCGFVTTACMNSEASPGNTTSPISYHRFWASCAKSLSGCVCFPCPFVWKTTLFQDQVGCVISSCAGLHSRKVFDSEEKTDSKEKNHILAPFEVSQEQGKLKKKKRIAEELSQGDISEDTQIYV